MKIASTIARLLLGLVFTVFGLNGFLHFIPNMAMPDQAVALFTAFAGSGYMIALIFCTQTIGGIFLLTGMYVPLGLAILAPVVVNIFMFHLYLAPGGLGIASVVAALELFLVWSNRAAFAPMLRAK
jgi:hypothetical protein